MLIFQRIVVLALLCMSVDAATKFTLPKDQEIVCTDSFSNVCTAPVSCNKNGRIADSFKAGTNFNIGKTVSREGFWYIVGGYTISFPSICDVTW